ncbi:MAG TPA: hypothetical protein PKW21_12260 [Rhabdaerophilum sp.]|nr:hypothetical protein [Rhabdaerophilum sp.]
MDTRLSQGAPTISQAPVRVEAAQVRAAVQTELAPPVAVSAQVGAEQARWSRDQRRVEAQAAQRRNESSIETDRETGDLIYKVVDPETRATVTQYPYESILKLRAYIRAVNDTAG